MYTFTMSEKFFKQSDDASIDITDDASNFNAAHDIAGGAQIRIEYRLIGNDFLSGFDGAEMRV